MTFKNHKAGNCRPIPGSTRAICECGGMMKLKSNPAGGKGHYACKKCGNWSQDEVEAEE